MTSPLGSSQPSPPVVPPIEHRGVRYMQDVDRQRRDDGQRGGWLLALDATSGARLWAVQVYADPHDPHAPTGSPARWFARMQLLDHGERIEIEDTTGARYEVDLATRVVVRTRDPAAGARPRGDNRPMF